MSCGLPQRIHHQLLVIFVHKQKGNGKSLVREFVNQKTRLRVGEIPLGHKVAKVMLKLTAHTENILKVEKPLKSALFPGLAALDQTATSP